MLSFMIKLQNTSQLSGNVGNIAAVNPWSVGSGIGSGYVLSLGGTGRGLRQDEQGVPTRLGYKFQHPCHQVLPAEGIHAILVRTLFLQETHPSEVIVEHVLGGREGGTKAVENRDTTDGSSAVRRYAVWGEGPK